MPDSIFPLLVFGFGITGASILYTGKCSIYYILGEATNPSLGSKKRLGDHQIQENGASMLKVARVNH